MLIAFLLLPVSIGPHAKRQWVQNTSDGRDNQNTITKGGCIDVEIVEASQTWMISRPVFRVQAIAVHVQK
ncbi:hypothetical protein L596_003235 [Steinernema carpocapsae]|uniref:Secreted protein n=1 Tax=Steinernema carpocapsae TaxID=34508 RepID=A0A4V6I7X8_STECR|nr:hypothetical protein L596_003235 [Steinernema carpocapsae]